MMKTIKRFCLRVLSGRTASCASSSFGDKAPLGDLGTASLLCLPARETGGSGIEDDVMFPSWMVEECGGVVRGKAVMKFKVVRRCALFGLYSLFAFHFPTQESI